MKNENSNNHNSLNFVHEIKKLNKYGLNMKNTFFIGIIVLTLTGCSVKVVKIPINDRIKCLIAPLKDLTGTYDPVSPKIETLIEQESDSAFAKYEHRGTSSSYNKTIYVTK